MKFDILDQYLPWRYLVGQCLQSGHLPLWNPYTHLGYPLNADPQSGAWYPIAWFIGMGFGYNIYWIQTEYLFHVWLAGCGMFLLVKELAKNENVAWLAGASYLLSGFFTGNAQHLTWIISGAWVPFILCNFLMMARLGHLKYILYCALCFFMLITGGYPAFTIVLLYILIALSIIIIIRKWHFNYPIFPFIKSLLIFGVSTILLSSVMLVSIADSFRIAGRAEGLSRELAMANPFSPQSMLSWLFPLSSVKDADLFQTDPSMSNGYFGLMMMAGLFISFFRKKYFLEKVILIGSLFFLIAAMGSYMPLRGWMYDYIPLMNLFRMPGLFRLFTIIGFIMLASFSIADIYQRKNVSASFTKPLLAISVLLITGIVIIIFRGAEWSHFNSNGYVSGLQDLKFNESMLLQGIVQLTCIALFLVFLKNKTAFYLLVIDGVLACWLCAPVTIVSTLKITDLQEKINQLPVSFRIPDLTPMDKNVDRDGFIGPLWCNLGIWKKQPIKDGYNNFQTKDFLLFEKSAIAKYVLKNPIIYQSLTASIDKKSNADSMLLINDSTHLLLDELTYENNVAVPVAKTQMSLPELTAFSPYKIEASVDNTVDCYFTLLQQYTTGWKICIDEKENMSMRSNGLFISTKVKAGKHKISFIYNDKKTAFAFYMSAFSLLVALVLLAVNRKTISSPSPYF